ncbi:hypothetical protein JL722_4219 [Aureococcus anophagefferens]|nr:hypothetical protein JL722_4219 [Aureococcus anophagefferens]
MEMLEALEDRVAAQTDGSRIEKQCTDVAVAALEQCTDVAAATAAALERSAATIADYEAVAGAYARANADHDVSQNVEALLSLRAAAAARDLGPRLRRRPRPGGAGPAQLRRLGRRRVADDVRHRRGRVPRGDRTWDDAFAAAGFELLRGYHRGDTTNYYCTVWRRGDVG